jgi:hypothetical protein
MLNGVPVLPAAPAQADSPVGDSPVDQGPPASHHDDSFVLDPQDEPLSVEDQADDPVVGLQHEHSGVDHYSEEEEHDEQPAASRCLGQFGDGVG